MARVGEARLGEIGAVALLKPVTTATLARVVMEALRSTTWRRRRC
jgi:hypothetical protein